MKKYKFAMASLMVLLAFTGMSQAMAADGTTGEIDFDQTSVSEDTMVYVHFKDLTGGADYMVNWTGDDTGYSWTTGSSQDDIYIPITFSKPSSGNAFVLTLRYQSAGTAIDSITVYVTEADQVLNTAAFLAIVVPLLVFSIIVAIYKSVGKGKGN